MLATLVTATVLQLRREKVKVLLQQAVNLQNGSGKIGTPSGEPGKVFAEDRLSTLQQPVISHFSSVQIDFLVCGHSPDARASLSFFPFFTRTYSLVFLHSLLVSFSVSFPFLLLYFMVMVQLGNALSIPLAHHFGTSFGRCPFTLPLSLPCIL